MKKIAVMLAVITFLLVPISAQAATPRIISIRPGIAFDGITANCSVIVFAENNDDIEITVKLWQGSRCVATWTDNGVTYLIFNQSANVTKGKEYELTVDAVIDDVKQSRVSYTGTC